MSLPPEIATMIILIVGWVLISPSFGSWYKDVFRDVALVLETLGKALGQVFSALGPAIADAHRCVYGRPRRRPRRGSSEDKMCELAKQRFLADWAGGPLDWDRLDQLEREIEQILLGHWYPNSHCPPNIGNGAMQVTGRGVVNPNIVAGGRVSSRGLFQVIKDESDSPFRRPDVVVTNKYGVPFPPPPLETESLDP